MQSNFRKNLNKWGTIFFGSLIGVSVLSSLYNKVASGGINADVQPLSTEEQAELEQIKNSNNLANQLGHDISGNIKLIVATDNFGEKKGCVISIQGHDPKMGLINHRWDLRYQISIKGDRMVWTANSLDNNAKEVRVFIGDKRYDLTERLDEVGNRGIEPSAEFTNSFLKASDARAVSGMLGNRELSNDYDLSGFRKAYLFATQICKT